MPIKRNSCRYVAASHGLHFVGMGISGGAEGARHGPSLMPGCSKHAYDALAPILNAMVFGVGDGGDGDDGTGEPGSHRVTRGGGLVA